MFLNIFLYTKTLNIHYSIYRQNKMKGFLTESMHFNSHSHTNTTKRFALSLLLSVAVAATTTYLFEYLLVKTSTRLVRYQRSWSNQWHVLLLLLLIWGWRHAATVDTKVIGGSLLLPIKGSWLCVCVAIFLLWWEWRLRFIEACVPFLSVVWTERIIKWLR